MKTALITGITGQDGSYLTELLLQKGYRVRGIVRRASYPHTERIDHLLRQFDDRDAEARLRLQYADLTDTASVRNVLESVQPDEVYNLGAQSHVGISFDTAESTLDINAVGTLRLLDTIHRMGSKPRYYQASSSEMFGASAPPQNEETRFLPQSPYGVAKVAAFYLTRMHRVAYGTFAANGILFNHESPRRGVNFVTRKVTIGIAKLASGEIDNLYLGYLDAKRDWGFAGDYVRAIHSILQLDEADDFVIATGEAHTVREFTDECFGLLGLDWQDFVRFDQKYLRPAEVPSLLGDATKARKALNWKPQIHFKELCRMMLESDLKAYGFDLDSAGRRLKERRLEKI